MVGGIRMEQENTVATSTTKRNLKYQAILEVVVAIALLVVINIISSNVFTRIDFTKEKRYTLSDASKDLAKKLDDIVYVKVYLDGELNPDFERLKKSAKEMLDEFRVASNGKIDYEFTDPLEGKNNKEKAEIIQQLRESGLEPTEVFDNKGSESSRRIVVPGAIFYYKTNYAYPMHLLKRQMGQNAQQVLNKSIEGLEYEIIAVLRKITSEKAKKVAFLEGHGELNEMQVADFATELDKVYKVERFDLNMDTGNVNFLKQFAGGFSQAGITEEQAAYWLTDTLQRKLNSYNALIIAKPTLAFTEQEKYYLDQYVMNGGKLLWLIDPLLADLDTISVHRNVMTADYTLNLNDMLFEYGVRINTDLIQDGECNTLPLGPDKQMFPWVYDPLIVSKSEHIIVDHLNPVWFRFVSSIDTVGKGNISKKILLTSSQFSRPLAHPVELDFATAIKPPSPAVLNKPEKAVAVLLEGKFTSLFKNRRRGQFDPGMKFKEQSPESGMIVVSDGDIIRNHIRSTGEIYPLGYDFFTRRVFDNKKFMVNCVDYLTGETTLIKVRGKEFEIRPLNMTKVQLEAGKWRTINMVVPVALVVIFGLINGYVRRRKYVR